MSILLNANIVISNEPFQHIYSINIAMLESAMNDNIFSLPSCSDSRRWTRRLTTETDINFSRVRHFVHPTLFGCTYLHPIFYNSLFAAFTYYVVNNLVKLYINVTV